jgi:Cu(I)/Ag(I) efflux system protein CusF
MKASVILAAVTLLAACTAPQDEYRAATADPAMAPQAQPPTPAPMSDMTAATVATASGVVEAIDAAAGSIVIAHGPVPALQWPAMTMAFKTGTTDVSAIKPGDRVAFEFTSSGMDGTLTKITLTKITHQ